MARLNEHGLQRAVGVPDLCATAYSWPRRSRDVRAGFVTWVAARLMAARLDRRIAAGEDLLGDAALASRASQLVSRRARGRVASGLERSWSGSPELAVWSAAIPVDRQAIEIGRPALEGLARALRSPGTVEPRGVALARILLTEMHSALYRPAYPEELYVVAREALSALGLFARGPDGTAVRTRLAMRPTASS